jgi:hypothetical protein
MEVDPALIIIPLPEDNPPQQHMRDIKLPVFLQNQPCAWFLWVESGFCLRGINDDCAKFNHVLSALPAEMVAQVINIVDTLPAVNQYKFVKAQILEAQMLSDYEKFDRLVKMEPMSGRKPSQLLHTMMEFCPAGLERQLSFHYLYMQRLPQALRTQLNEVQLGNPGALGLREDRFRSIQATGGGTVDAPNSSEEQLKLSASIAAVRGGATRGKSSCGCGKPVCRGLSRAAVPAAAPLSPPVLTLHCQT